MPVQTTRLLLRNHAAQSGVVFNAPLPAEDVNYPLANLRNADRYVVWSCPAGAGDTQVWLDVGAGHTTNAVGLLGYEAGNVFPTQYYVQAGGLFRTSAVFPVTGCSTTNTSTTLTRASGSFIADGIVAGMTVAGTNIQAGTTVVSRTATTLVMSLAGTGTAGSLTINFQDPTWTAVGGTPSISGVRDSVQVLGAPVTYRFWLFTLPFNADAGFTLGKLLVGQFVDLGIAYSPGSTETLIRQRVRNERVTGAPVITETGLPRRRFVFQFNSVPQSMRDTLMGQAAVTPSVLVDPFGRPWEFELSDDTMTATHTWGSPDLYDVAMDVQTLP